MLVVGGMSDGMVGNAEHFPFLFHRFVNRKIMVPGGESGQNKLED
jgi:hypothetical protein